MVKDTCWDHGKTLPKLELAVNLTYFIVFVNTRRPDKIPFSKTIKSFLNKITSADSFATSTAVSTEIPTSAARIAPASFIPSPKSQQFDHFQLTHLQYELFGQA